MHDIFWVTNQKYQQKPCGGESSIGASEGKSSTRSPVIPLLLSAVTATLNFRFVGIAFLQGKCGLREINYLAPNYPLMIVISSLSNTKKD